MNRVYIITYDIRNTWIRNYNPLFNALMSFPHWMHHMDNTWFVVTALTPQQIYNFLAPYIYTDCRILVTRFTSDYFGLLDQDAWNWISTHRDLL